MLLHYKEISFWKIKIILQEMEEQVKLGRTRSIGLSNFNEEQISTIWENAQIKPSNLQVSNKGSRTDLMENGFQLDFAEIKMLLPTPSW